MAAIGIILIVLTFCILCGLAATTNLLEKIIKNQLEIIRILKK